ncbi:SART-1 protein [Calycina marina]|uniref:SART-1 protein n=1 Tax=Calycina marina TaxID=1763456 RepID=A0A9P7Z2A5_9HELO|nr:SART-1 protein [Calycina marina]
MTEISIEETNRLRASLGMKPLPIPGAPPSGPVFMQTIRSGPAEEVASTLETRQAESYENYSKAKEADESKKRREAKAEAIKKARDAAKRFSKLEGKGLGDEDENEEMDTRSWLIKQKKRQKEIEKARNREQELAEAEVAAAAEYTVKDLAGVKVGHELDAFEEGEEQILTLKDHTIDENEEEGDELENLTLRERERLNENLDRKKKKTYDPLSSLDGEKQLGAWLEHYDEEINGKQGKRFTLDGQGSTTEAAIQSAAGAPAKPKAISLEFLKDEPKSDYLDISEIKIKKPKKKKKAKYARKNIADEDDIFPSGEAPNTIVEFETQMDVDEPAKPTIRKRTYEDVSFVDDDELAASLAAQRRNALKKRQRFRPEELAQQMREEASASPMAIDENEDAPGLVIDETSEFVANIQKPAAPMPKARATSQKPETVTALNDNSDEGDVNMAQSYADLEDEEDRIERLKRQEFANADIDTGLGQEATLDRGIGTTLKLLRDRNILKDENSGDKNEQYRRRQQFIADKHRQAAEAERQARTQRERDRQSGRLDRMTAREKEDYARQQNTYRDQQEARKAAQHFEKEYKPTVELKYIDEMGRSLNQKEAFKHLSHHFHGKGSGKQKVEKKLRKIEDEKRREAQSSLDGSQIGGMSGAATHQLKKNRQAGVRLA